MSVSFLFRPENIAAQLQALAPLTTPVMDSVFSDRVQIPFAYVGKEEVLAVTKELPVVLRGQRSIEALPLSFDATFFEPLPVRMNSSVLAQELNNLKQLHTDAKNVWVRNKIDQMRRIYRKTTEAVCAVALSGKLEWPIRLPGASTYETYTVEYGDILSYSPGKLWSAADIKIADVFRCLKDMKKHIQTHGFGAKLEIWAGDDAFEALLGIAEDAPEKTKIPMEFNEQGVNVAGFLVKSRSETYTNPETDEPVPVVPSNTVRMIATDAGHRLAYCAVDDLNANLQPHPFFVKAVESKDPSGLTLIGEGKPFPIVNVKGVCDAVTIGT